MKKSRLIQRMGIGKALCLLVIVLIGVTCFVTPKIFADAAGTGIPSSEKSRLAGGCSSVPGKTFWDLWFPSSIPYNITSMALSGANYVCSNANSTEAPATSGSFYNIAVRDATTNTALSVSSTTINVGTTQKGQYSSVGAITVSGINMAAGTCHSFLATFQVQAQYNGNWSRSGGLSTSITVCKDNPPPPPPPPNQLPRGNFDEHDCSGITGWTFDPDSSSSSSRFIVYVNGAQVGIYTTNLYRGDVNNAYHITGNHGFSFNPNGWSQFNPRQVNTIRIDDIDMQTGQTNNPISYNVGPCAADSCGSSTLPATAVVGSPVTFTVSANFSVPYGPPYTTNDPILVVTVYDPTSHTTTYSGTKVNYSVSGSQITSQSLSFTPSLSGNYRLQWAVGSSMDPSLNIQCGWGQSAGSPNTLLAGFEPYFNVFGGDIAAGAGYQTSSGACNSTDKNAVVKGWNQGSGGGYTGAGGALAAEATNQIVTFSTAQNANGASRPSGLAFANTTASGNTYGGGLYGPSPSTSDWCVPDYADKALNSGPVTTLSAGTYNPGGWTSGTYKINGDVTLTGGTVSNRVKLVVVNGSVYVSGDITYGSYSTLATIPQFNLIVQGGNIYIGSGVHSMYGVYVAQPTNSTNGVMHTCATGLGSRSTDYGTCNSQLSIHGAVSAAHLDLERSFGSIVTAGGVFNAPAELFTFDPSVWLSDIGNPTGNVTAGSWQSITSLPPIL